MTQLCGIKDRLCTSNDLSYSTSAQPTKYQQDVEPKTINLEADGSFLSGASIEVKFEVDVRLVVFFYARKCMRLLVNAAIDSENESIHCTGNLIPSRNNVTWNNKTLHFQVPHLLKLELYG